MPIPENILSFEKTLSADYPPDNWPEALKAIWWDYNNNWDRSHNIAQEIQSDTGNWIHAYLHRQEGDKWNAGYWYNRADRAYPSNSLDQEREEILQHILSMERLK